MLLFLGFEKTLGLGYMFMEFGLTGHFLVTTGQSILININDDTLIFSNVTSKQNREVGNISLNLMIFHEVRPVT